MKKYIILLLPLIILSACVTALPEETIKFADYGAKPSDYERKIKKEFSSVLIDPTSPLYSFELPKKGYILTSPLDGSKPTFGWKVCGTINSKNRMGGYTGSVPFYTLFRNGKIVYYDVGQPDMGLMNSNLIKACGDILPAN